MFAFDNPALQRLLVNNWVRAEWGTSGTNRKVRIYTITPEGQKQLRQEIEEFGFLMAGITRVLESAGTAF